MAYYDEATKTPWYPSFKRADVEHHRFVVLELLKTDRLNVAKSAANYFESEIYLPMQRDTSVDVDGKTGQGLQNLLAMAKIEESKEREYLNRMNSITQGGYNTSDDPGAAIQAMSELHTMGQMFSRNIDKILEIKDGEAKNRRIDISRNFASYFNRELEKEIANRAEKNLNNLVNEKTIKEIIEKTIDRLYLSALSNKKIDENIRPLEDIYTALNNNPAIKQEYVDDIWNLYFKKAYDEWKAASKRDRKNKKSPLDIQHTGQKAGQLMELQEWVSLKLNDALKADSVKKVGSKGYAADTLLTVDFTLPENFFDAEVVSGEGAAGRHAINMRKFRDKLKEDSGYLVEISDKNYDLLGDFYQKNKGFSAKSNMTLPNLASMLRANKMDGSKLENLLVGIANLGGDRLTSPPGLSQDERMEYTSRYLASMIAYFVFDDVEIDEPPGYNVKTVHLFNLMGVYVPLSVLLFAVYNALINADYTNFVNVNIQTKSLNYKPGGRFTLTKEKWLDTFEQAYMSNTVSVSFYKDFVSYVDKYLRGMGIRK